MWATIISFFGYIRQRVGWEKEGGTCRGWLVRACLSIAVLPMFII